MGSMFLNGGIALATVFLIAIPIIIHLINRRRFRRLDWAAMEFLLQALKKNRRRIRLEQLLLLLLRVGLVALAGLALARPVLSGRGMEWLARAFRSEEKLFLLDDSFSTARQEAGRTTFGQEVSTLQESLRRLAETASGDRLTLVRGSHPRQPLVRGAFLDRERAAAVAASLAKLSPTDVRLPLAGALEALADLAAREEAEALGRPRVVSILTDLRLIDWTDGAGGRNEALARALARLAGAAENPARLVVFDLGVDDPTNVAVTGVTVEGGRPVAGLATHIKVEVRNFGPVAVRGLGLRLGYAALAGPGAAPGPGAPAAAPPAFASALGPPLPELAPLEARTVTVPLTFRAAGHYGVTVEVSGASDPLPGDNLHSLTLEVVDSTEVLLVNGEPASEPAAGETVFLEYALAPGADAPSGITPVVAVEDSLPAGGLDRFGAVFLANVYSPPPAFLARLDEYVRAGGTLVIFLGDQVDSGLYNRRLGAGSGPGDNAEAAPAGAREAAGGGDSDTGGTASTAGSGLGLLPAYLGEAVVADTNPVELHPALDGPLFDYLRGAEEALRDPPVRFARYVKLTPLPAAAVLARFAAADGPPALVEGSAGKGRVFLFGSAADMEWSSWPRNPTYLITVERLVAEALRGRGEGAQHLAGAAVEVPLDLALHGREGRLRTPAWPAAPERTLLASPAPAASPEGGAAYRFVIEETQSAGIYALGLKDRKGETEWRPFAVRRDASESDLRRISAARLAELYPEVELTVLKDPEGLAAGARGRFEASDLFLGAFLGFLFLEGYLAWRFARHGAAPTTGAGGPGTAGGARKEAARA